MQTALALYTPAGEIRTNKKLLNGTISRFGTPKKKIFLPTITFLNIENFH
jgi:hypothetical protein